jgi:hypothetical protein
MQSNTYKLIWSQKRKEKSLLDKKKVEANK